jgi:crotonobetainyl-CoA:carnitine CoA-transferase CaiB-like acyl-CoA transferase
MAAASPLENLKVLDFSRVLAGPFAGRMLADLGADVVKVEPPDGDVTRLWGHVIANIPGYYHQQNAGKRNICVDLRHPDARELILDLARSADLVIENYRPDVMKRLGIDYDALSAVNPRLIMLSISGFGHDGPESHRPAYAPIVHAEAGLIDRSARRSESSHRDLPLSVADTNASLHGLVALLSAVIMRERTGRGQHIDIAMLDATMATDDQLHYDLEDSEHTGPLPSATWETGAGPILISADFRYLWKLLVEFFDMADPSTPDMALTQKIAVRRAAINTFLAGLEDWQAVEDAMNRMNLAWGQVRAAATLTSQPTVQARGSIAEVDDRAGGQRPITQSPYRFSDATSGVRGPAPHRGEHNVEILNDWLGRTPADAEQLEQTGVLLHAREEMEQQ